jgi:hemin uptake protein HemP
MLLGNPGGDNLYNDESIVLTTKSLMSNDSQDEDPQNDPQDDDPRLPKIIPFEQLARCGEEIWIECGGQIYRLRRTRMGKLILTK